MVPGMTERERQGIDIARLAWLADARLGPAPHRAAPSAASSVRVTSHSSLDAALQRVRTHVSRGVSLLRGRGLETFLEPGGSSDIPQVPEVRPVTGAAMVRHAKPFALLTSRRSSLLALGGMAAWLNVRQIPAEAKKTSNAVKKSKKRCQQQGNACEAFALRLCAHVHPPSPIRSACENRASACCSSIEQCDASAYYECLFEHIEDLVPV